MKGGIFEIAECLARSDYEGGLECADNEWRKDAIVCSFMKKWIHSESDYSNLNFLKTKSFYSLTNGVSAFLQLEKEISSLLPIIPDDIWQSLKTHFKLRHASYNLYLKLDQSAQVRSNDFVDYIFELSSLFDSISISEIRQISSDELAIFQSLLDTEKFIREFKMMETCVFLHNARESLQNWKSKSITETNMMMWYSQWTKKLAWKARLYFRQLYRPQSSILDYDYIKEELDLFLEKCNTTKILLVYLVEPGSIFQEEGYSCLVTGPLTGIKAFPCILSYPEEFPPLNHWPNIVSIIQSTEFQDFILSKQMCSNASTSVSMELKASKNTPSIKSRPRTWSNASQIENASQSSTLVSRIIHFVSSPSSNSARGTTLPEQNSIHQFHDSRLNVLYQMDLIDTSLVLVTLQECTPLKEKKKTTNSFSADSSLSESISTGQTTPTALHQPTTFRFVIDERKRDQMKLNFVPLRDALLEICRDDHLFVRFKDVLATTYRQTSPLIPSISSSRSFVAGALNGLQNSPHFIKLFSK